MASTPTTTGAVALSTSAVAAAVLYVVGSTHLPTMPPVVADTVAAVILMVGHSVGAYLRRRFMPEGPDDSAQTAPVESVPAPKLVPTFQTPTVRVTDLTVKGPA